MRSHRTSPPGQLYHHPSSTRSARANYHQHRQPHAIVPYDFEGPGGQQEYRQDLGRQVPPSAISPFSGTDPFALDSFFMRDPMRPMQQMMTADNFFMPRGGLFDALDMIHPMMHPSGGMNFESSPSGQFHSEVMMMSGTIGPDGRPQYKKFAQTTRGDTRRGVREMQAAYEDSNEGLQKRALERQIGEKGRKVIHEKNLRTGEESRNDLLRGMQDEETHQFDRQWQSEETHLPSRRGMGRLEQPIPRASRVEALQDSRHPTATRYYYPGESQRGRYLR